MIKILIRLLGGIAFSEIEKHIENRTKTIITYLAYNVNGRLLGEADTPEECPPETDYYIRIRKSEITINNAKHRHTLSDKLVKIFPGGKKMNREEFRSWLNDQAHNMPGKKMYREDAEKKFAAGSIDFVIRSQNGRLYTVKNGAGEVV